MTFVTVETIDEVLKEALNIDLPGPVASFAGNGLTPVQSAP
jgi:ATP-dependent Lon protease